MNLFETIVAANHRALAGDTAAGLHPADFAQALPIAALSCIDPRLNQLLPDVLGIPQEEFIWLRNAGNIVTGSLSSTVRSLALACALRNVKEIAILGHTDCLVRQTTVMDLTARFHNLGITRDRLPDNINEYFGLFASERQNVMKAVDWVRRSPIIGLKIPVHGLLLDIQTGNLEWIVNGYEAVNATRSVPLPSAKPKETTEASGLPLSGSNPERIKSPDLQIGERSPVPQAAPPLPTYAPVFEPHRPPSVRVPRPGPMSIPLPPPVRSAPPKRPPSN